MSKPYAESCDQNREPIYSVLRDYLAEAESLLEIGSGTGQHAVYFAEGHPQLQWQTSELPELHAGIQRWIEESNLSNVLPPLSLDVCTDWPDRRYDLVYSANTLHIMSANQVACLFRGLPDCLQAGAYLIVYGPFNYGGEYTSASNRQFDVWLKQRDPLSGIKDVDWLRTLAEPAGLILIGDLAMPANNRMLIWQAAN